MTASLAGAEPNGRPTASAWLRPSWGAAAGRAAQYRKPRYVSEVPA